MTNTLSNFYRIPKISINLPSGSDFYSKDEVELGMDGSLPIRAMTARDELMLKSPDALLNGEALVHIIKSCVPEIKNVKKLLAPDVEAILLGIFHGSYGPKLKFESECTNPECKHVNNFEVVIRQLLDSSAQIDIPKIIELETGIPDSKLRAYITPYTFETNTKHQLTVFHHNKMLQVMASDDIDDMKKLDTFNECFAKIVELKFENAVNCIKKIEIIQLVNGEEQITVIDEYDQLKDFIFNAERAMIDPITTAIDQLNVSGIDKVFKAQCSKCEHEWSTAVEFNPISFFVRSSNQSGLLT